VQSAGTGAEEFVPGPLCLLSVLGVLRRPGARLAILLIWLGAIANGFETYKLSNASFGAQRLETVSQRRVNARIRRYAEFGWQVTGQSTRKSFGHEARR